MIYSLVVYDNDLNVTDVISFSAVTSAEESYKAQTTDNVVEYGFTISDHIITNSPEISLDVILSAYSIFSDSLLLEWNGTEFVTGNALSGASTEDDHLVMKQKLIDIIKKRQLFTLLITKKDSYIAEYSQKAQDLLNSVVGKFPNCVITSLDFSDKSNSASAVFAKMTIKQIRVARTEKFNVDPSTVKWVQKKTVATTVGGTATGAATGKDANGNPIEGSDSAPTMKDGKTLEGKFGGMTNASNKGKLARLGSEALGEIIEVHKQAKAAGIDINADVTPLYKMIPSITRGMD